MINKTDYQYKHLIKRLLDWEKVQKRLDKYPYINEHFPLEFLQKYSDRPPYYSHFLAWPLGTWKGESHFQHLDRLLATACNLTNWDRRKCTSYPPEYSHFFSFMWELQIASFFAQCPYLTVYWTKSGPDLRILHKKEQIFVECYVYQKSFGIELFVIDVLRQLHPWLNAKHGSNMKVTLLNVSITEAIKNKSQANKLKEHRPNLLAVNFAMSLDYQRGIDRIQFFQQSMPNGELSAVFDGFLFATCGIDAIPDKANYTLQIADPLVQKVIHLVEQQDVE